MFGSTGEVVFIHSDQVSLILASSHGYLLGNIRGDIKNIYPELALYGRKNECARTDTVFFAISQVCPWGVTLVFGLNFPAV